MKSFSILTCAFGFFALFISVTTIAQQPVNNIIASKKTTDGRYHFIKFDASKPNQSRNLSQPEQIKNLLGLGGRHSFVANESINSNAAFKRDNQGADHVRYQQYFNGIKVEFADITLHIKNGSLNLLTGEYFNIPEGLSTTPALSEKAALSKALSFMGAKKYSWEDTSFKNSSLKSLPKGELVICKSFTGEANNPGAQPQMELAYKFAVYATEPLRYDFIYVSAQTGNILLDNPIIKHTNGTAATRYSGSRTIVTTQSGSSNYVLKDSGGNYNVATYNMSRGTNYSSATNFADNDNNWTDAEYNNSNYDNAALDAHWGAMMTQDYWRTVHNRNSFDNKGSKINSYVHYSNLYANAYWDGIEMTYGDGDGLTMGPLTSIDICGHEIGHAVCQYTANLIYSNESGAINEGFSDIWGACIKRYADASKNTWIAGDEIFTNGSGIRSLSNPKSHTQPDTYKGIYWYTGTGDNGGVHYNSGIMNYWFYLLTEGKSGTNDNGKTYSVSGIGITKAAQIAYRAESVYMFPAAAYADTRVLTIQAAEDLFGAGSNEAIQTTAAWNAVGVFEVLARPDSVTATLVNNTVTINWRFASTQSIAGFTIERAVNGLNNFVTIGTVAAGIRTFTDTGFINNSQNQYRVRSFRGDSLYSDYSAVASVSVGNAPFIMTNGSYTTCGTTFFDPGGSGNYPSGSYTMTLRPAIAGNKLQIAFSLFNTNYYDYLYIYSGPTTSSPLLGTYYGTTLPPVLQSTAAGGELTFVFNPYYSNSYPGWKAFVNCFRPVTAPGNLAATVDSLKDVHLTWTDNSTDETGYAVERSVNDTLHFQSIVSLSANNASYIDTAAPDNSYIYYRVRAYRDSVGSQSSNIASVIIGNLYIMQNGSLTTCGVTFLDPGGTGNYSSGYNTTTFRPAAAGSKLKILFGQFNTNSYDYLYIYNGPSSSSPLLGLYSGTTLPPVLQSTAAGGELTFVFNPSYSGSYPGWSSYISCYKPVAAASNLTATKNGVKNVQLTWVDNATDETGYVVERSLNDSIHYSTLIYLPVNAVGYNDTSAPDNSYIYYRVKALRDSITSPYSNQVAVINGNLYIMQNGTVSTCSITFLDPGGFGNYNNGLSYTTTFTPSETGKKLKVVFSQFGTESCCDYLRIYNGPSSSFPLLGQYQGSALPPAFESTAPNGELTFVFYSDGSSVSTGWQAYINCFKPVAKPSGVKALTNSSSKISITWTDNAGDETNYVVERSVNASSQFTAVALLPSNTSQYIDSAAPANSLLYYRVRAYRDSTGSLYSDTASVAFGNAPFLMKDSTLITCDKVFVDPGGVDIIPLNNGSYYNTKTTFKPAISGNNIKVTFSKFRLNGYLYVYNGPSSSSPLLGNYSGTYTNTSSLNFNGTGADGSLTFIYQGYAYNDSGWVAQVSCYKPVAKPSGVKVTADTSQRIKVTWTDNADDETRYVVERSVNASSLFTPVAQLQSNTNQYTDSAAPANSLLYYRVKAYRDTTGSFYSDTASVPFGNAPFLMKDSTLVTCDKVFMDPGGADIIPQNSNYYNIKTTFKPPIAGNNVRVAFSKFRLNNGTLYVYNGSSNNSPLIGNYSGYYLNPPVFDAATSADGSLTFVYQGYSYSDSGWVAQVSCYKPVAKPTGLKAVADTSQRIKLTWTDNANDETRYVVERSVNAPSLFTPLAQLPSNSNQYTDSTAPANSLLYYRVKANRDTIGSFYSDTASIAVGNAPFLMKDSTVITCNKVFMDPGGVDVIPRTSNYSSIKTTFKPGISGNNINATFSKFGLYSGSLYVYNGPTTNSPLIGYYNGSYANPLVFNGTGTDGSLTFVYQAYPNSDSGWVAQVSCYKPVGKPTGVKAIADTSQRIKLTWSDNADDETRYVVERSVNAPSLFTPVAQLPSNTSQYTDSAAPANSLLYYRVKAYRDTTGSFYSDTALLAFGNAPFLMKDSTVVTCNKVFMDPGGVDIVSQQSGAYFNVRSTFKPAVAGNNINVTFSKFRLTNGTLYVYNGPSANSPLIGSYSGYYSNPPVFDAATSADGSLTFVYQGYYYYSDSGWLAQVSCYKPIAKPSGLKVVLDSEQRIKLTWTDNATDETRYVVERSVNANSLFTPVTQLLPNTTQYTDSTPVLNSLLYCRIRAYRDTLSSLPGDTAFVAFGNIPFLMKDSTLITCNKVFMDPAGADVLKPNNYYTARATFKPGAGGSNIKVVFNKFNLNGYLYVYNGPTTSSPLIGNYYGSYAPNSLVFKGTGTDGSLTFSYQGYGYGDSGWIAQVNCYKPVAAPVNLTADTILTKGVRLKWTDNANNETSYVVERSVTDSLHFQSIANLPANTTAYTDSAAPGNSFIYYRVAAYIDSVSFEYSNTASVFVGTPYIMQNGTVSTCGIVFLDPGGFGNYSNNSNFTTTFTPSEIDKKLRVVFSQFSTESCCDYLSIYNGPSTSYPLLGQYKGSTLPPTLQSTAQNGELTFQFYSDGSSVSTGWQAYIGCFKPVLKPSGLKATADSSSKINLIWTDNAPDETKYVVERSVNAPSLYVSVAALPANTTQYTDSAAPANSLLYYRVRAYRDTEASLNSDTAVIAFGNSPFVMKDSTLITCSKVFLDPGGVDIISQQSGTYFNTRTTFKPAVAGNNINVSFSKFRLNGYLYVYNGPTTSSPSLGSYSGNYTNTAPLVFNSTSLDGSLTFVYSGYSYSDSGWLAQVSCYKPVARPTGVKAAADTSSRIKITWTDNANDETKYVVERSVNAPSLYTTIAQLPPNTIEYTDSNVSANSLIYYRVKAYRDTSTSLYSDTATIAIGNAPYVMKDSTLITCSKVFLDPGGVDIIPQQSNYYNIRTTFKPSVAGNNINVSFSKFRLNGYLYVYNGPTTSSPQIGSYSGNYTNTTPLVFNSTAADGSLTFYYSGYSYSDSGWVAQVSCIKGVAKPTGIKAIADSVKGVRLTWTDNADDETKYIVERSVNAPSLFKTLAQLPPNSSLFTDTTAPANSLLYYRVRAYRDTSASLNNDTAVIAFGNAPFIMKDSTLITCSKVFLDPGGADVIPQQSNYYSIRTTFKPSIPGNNINVAFSNLKFSGYLYVYNGPSTSSPQIASLNAYSNPLSVFNSTAADGSLTFYYSGYSYSDSGWVAQVSCIKAVAKPSGVKAIADSSQQIKVTWTDNADDETKYVVERSVNAPSKYAVVGQLPSNTVQFTDSSAPANSLLFYRVRAYRDTLPSLYSDTATVASGNAPFLMKDSTLITCSKVFMDPGGTDVIPSGINYYTRTTFKPGITGNNVKVVFSKLALNGYLYVFDGPSTSSPLIGTLGYYYPNSPLTYSASGSDGSLTFLYSGTSYSDSGWVGQVSCFKPVAVPVNLTAVANNQKNVNLNWTDNANDEKGYTIERSFNDSLNFNPVATLPANATSYTDTSAAANSFIFYRVRAFRDSVASAYSNTVSVLNGTVFTMRSGKVTTCGITFLDPGGAGDYGNNANYTTTFAPAESGKKTRVTFSAFSTESCCDYLNVYNGANISSPLIGTYLGSALPPVLQSTALGGELTFRFITDGAVTGSGWNAAIDCIKTSDTLVSCSTDSNEINTITSNITGPGYQWQKYNGTAFVTMTNDLNNTGTNTVALQVKNAGLSAFEKFRCMVNGSLSAEFVVIKGNRWTGNVSTAWTDPKNWSCGIVPNSNTDVLIESGMQRDPTVNSNGECRSLTILKGATLNVAPGYNLNVRH